LLVTTLASLVPVYSDDLPKLLIISPDGAIFQETIRGMESEIEESFTLKTMTITKETYESQIGKKIAAEKPNALVIMGNRAIRLYKKHLKAHSGENDTLPVIALLASQVEKSVSSFKQVQGINYETPMVTALVNFRSIIGKNINNVGVIYRSVYEPFVIKHTKFCKREKINVIGIKVGDNAKKHKREISKALKQLLQKDKVDVFWILNDNRLLKPELLMKVWIPTFTKYKIPVIVGVEALAKPKLNFGTYAVMPEPESIGAQAAEIIFELEESDWKFEKREVYPAISVYSVLNLNKLSGYTPDKLNLTEVNKVFKKTE
jgi:hypothetical protein